MGLKTDILKALEKNLTHLEVVGGKNKTVKPPIEKDSKLEVLAEDLANAILDFLTDRDRCVLKVDKLNASGGPVNVALTPLMSTPAAVGAPVFTTVPPIPMITVEVDKDVRLRKENVKGESGKY